MPKAERTYEVMQLGLVLEYFTYETKTHWVLDCPFCVDKKGHEADKPLLFFSKDKYVGLCFHCNTVVEIDFENQEDQEKYHVSTLDVTVTRLLSKLEDYNTSDRLQSVDISYLKPVTNSALLDYMYQRNPFYTKEFIDSLQLKEWVGSRNGVVIPSFVEGRAVSFQVRYITDEKPKYYTKPGVKPLYVPGGYNPSHQRAISICEGKFDSFALKLMNYPYPTALLGASLGPHTTEMLRCLVPDIVYLCMDNMDLNNELQRVILKTFKLPPEIKLIDFGGLDPEEYLLKRLREQVSA